MSATATRPRILIFATIEAREQAATLGIRCVEVEVERKVARSQITRWSWRGEPIAGKSERWVHTPTWSALLRRGLTPSGRRCWRVVTVEAHGQEARDG